MKSNELMVGDWIAYIEDGKPYFARVSEVYQSSVFTEDGYFEGREVEEGEIIPIHFTPEIAEKNGFVNGTFGCYTIKLKKGDDVLYIFIPKEYNGFTEIEYDKVCRNVDEPEETLYGSNLEIPHPICVHELQHILKLFGFELEIKL